MKSISTNGKGNTYLEENVKNSFATIVNGLSVSKLFSFEWFLIFEWFIILVERKIVRK